MAEKEAYFFDTCAIIEIILGNKKYEKYKDVVKITTQLNLVELHYYLLRKVNSSYAKKIYHKLMRYTVPLYDKAIFDGNRLKSGIKGLSYVDCIGYAIAIHHKTKFLTGDKAFKDMPSVEFID